MFAPPENKDDSQNTIFFDEIPVTFSLAKSFSDNFTNLTNVLNELDWRIGSKKSAAKQGFEKLENFYEGREIREYSDCTGHPYRLLALHKLFLNTMSEKINANNIWADQRSEINDFLCLKCAISVSSFMKHKSIETLQKAIRRQTEMELPLVSIQTKGFFHLFTVIKDQTATGLSTREEIEQKFPEIDWKNRLDNEGKPVFEKIDTLAEYRSRLLYDAINEYMNMNVTPLPDFQGKKISEIAKMYNDFLKHVCTSWLTSIKSVIPPLDPSNHFGRILFEFVRRKRNISMLGKTDELMSVSCRTNMRESYPNNPTFSNFEEVVISDVWLSVQLDLDNRSNDQLDEKYVDDCNLPELRKSEVLQNIIGDLFTFFAVNSSKVIREFRDKNIVELILTYQNLRETISKWKMDSSTLSFFQLFVCEQYLRKAVQLTGAEKDALKQITEPKFIEHNILHPKLFDLEKNVDEIQSEKFRKQLFPVLFGLLEGKYRETLLPELKSEQMITDLKTVTLPYWTTKYGLDQNSVAIITNFFNRQASLLQTTQPIVDQTDYKSDAKVDHVSTAQSEEPMVINDTPEERKVINEPTYSSEMLKVDRDQKHVAPRIQPYTALVLPNYIPNTILPFPLKQNQPTEATEEEVIDGPPFSSETLKKAWKEDEKCRKARRAVMAFSDILTELVNKTIKTSIAPWKSFWERVSKDAIKLIRSKMDDDIAKDLLRDCEKQFYSEVYWALFNRAADAFMGKYLDDPVPDLPLNEKYNVIQSNYENLTKYLDKQEKALLPHARIFKYLRDFFTQKGTQVIRNFLSGPLTKIRAKADVKTEGNLIKLTWNNVDYQFVVDSGGMIEVRDVDNTRFPKLIDGNIQFFSQIPIDSTLNLTHSDVLYTDTFWNHIPNEVNGSGTWAWVMQEYLRQRYARTLCKDDVSSNRLAWFLTFWCQFQGVQQAFLEYKNNNFVFHADPASMILRHAITLLDDIFMYSRAKPHLPLDIHCAFHPFIRGFLDNISNQTWFINTDPKDNKRYLNCDDSQDELLQMLNLHPNQFLIRLSTTHPLHLEFLCLRTTPFKRIIFYRINMIDNGHFDKSKPYGPVYLLNAMQNTHIEIDTNKIPCPIHSFAMITWFMKQKSFGSGREDYFGPVMRNRGAFMQSLAAFCTTPIEQIYNNLEYFARQYEEQLYKDLLFTANPFVQLLYLYQNDQQSGWNFPKDSYQEVLNIYRNSKNEYSDLFPTFDQFGDVGCSSDPKWMTKWIPNTPPNVLMSECYRYVEKHFYNGCLWDCPANPGLRRLHIWHIIRWLGYDYWSSYKKRPQPPFYTQVDVLLRWILNSGEAYPFVDDEGARSMIALTESDSKYKNVVLRLSTKQSLRLALFAPNVAAVLPLSDPKYVPVDASKADEVDVTQWIESDFLDVNFSSNIQQVYDEVEYVVRTRIFNNFRSVLVRSYNYLKNYLDACRSSNRGVLAKQTTLQALSALDKYVHQTKNKNQISQWKSIRGATVRANASGEFRQIMGSEQMCGPGSYPRFDFTHVVNPTASRHVADVNRLVCANKPGWIFDQPLLTQHSLEQLRSLYTHFGLSTELINNMISVWAGFILQPIPNNLWCFTTPKRGCRNLTFILNWLGLEGLQVGSYFASRDFTRVSERIKPAQYESYVRFRALCELLPEVSFDLFMTPVEQDIVKYSFPGFLTVALSPTVPGAFSVKGISLDNLSDVDQTVKCSDIMLWMPEHVNDFFAVPFGILLRVMLFAVTGMHVAVLEEPKQEDAKSCRRAYVKPNLPKALTRAISNIKYQHRVSPAYLMKLTSIMIQSTYDNEEDAEKQQTWRQKIFTNLFDEKQQRIIDNSGYAFAAFYKLGKGAYSIANKARTYLAEARSNLISDFVGQFTNFFSDNENWWYNMGDFEQIKASNYLQRLLVGEDLMNDNKLQKWHQGSLQVQVVGGFIGNELVDITTHLKRTQIPVFLAKLNQPVMGNLNLLGLAVKFRRDEFGGQAWEQKDTEELKALYQGLGLQKHVPRTEQDWWKAQGQDLPLVKELAARRDPESHQELLGILHAKKINGTPMGPLEKQLAVQFRLVRAPLPPPPPSEPRVATTQRPRPSDTASGPPTVAVTDEAWRATEDQEQYFKILNGGVDPTKDRGFEESEVCKLSSDPNYVFPAFDVTPDGKIVARCGRSSWMSDIPASRLHNLDEKNKLLLTEIAKISKHWCPTIQHQIRLWQWLGVGCLGQNSVDFLAANALEEAANDVDVAPNNAHALVNQVSMHDQIQMIDQFRSGTKPTTKRDSKEKCHKRILFLSRMMTSNILFPYVHDRKTALRISAFDKDKVVVMLHWSQSGWIYAVRTTTSGDIQERPYDIGEIINYFQYPPTSVRLKIFQDFYGGICASNYQFYVEFLKQARRQDCTKSLLEMKRLSVMQPLPLSYQFRMQQIYARGNALSPAETKTIQELQNVSFLLQCKNLQAKEVDLFHEIMKLENIPVQHMSHAHVAEAAARLYKARDVDEKMSEAESFENLALCQRPEFVPFIRRKILNKYPEMKVAEVESMERTDLCKLLMNNTHLDQLVVPLYITQIENAPTQFVNKENGLLNLWDPSIEQPLNDWLMKQYGTTVKTMQEDNKELTNTPQLLEITATLKSHRSQKIAEQQQSINRLINFRRYLLSSEGRCSNLTSEECKAMTFTNTKNHTISLCTSGCEEAQDIHVLDLIDIMIHNFCDPNVILLANDLEFILQVFSILRNALMMMENNKPSAVPKMERETSRIALANLSMFKAFRTKLDHLAPGCWNIPLNSYVIQDRNSECGKLMHEFFYGSLLKPHPEPSANKWRRFRESPFRNKIPDFTVMMLLYEAFNNRILSAPQ